MHGSYSDTALIGDILAIMLICYQVINSVKISFSAFFALWQVKHLTCEESLSKSYADSEI